jgi:hypothetical protein
MADAIIPITIPEAKIAKATAYFLAIRPMPQIQDPAFPDDPSKTIDKYGIKQHIRNCIIEGYLEPICARGKKKVELQPLEEGMFI